MTQDFIVSTSYTTIKNDIFLSSAISASSMDKAKIFLSLFPLLIKALLLFFLFSSLLVEGFAIFKVRKV